MEGFLRGPWCQRARTHICVQCTICVCRNLPKSAHPTVMTQTFRIQCAWFHIYCAWGATLPIRRGFHHNIKNVNGMSFTIRRASFVLIQTLSSPILWLSSRPFDLHFQLSQVVSIPFGQHCKRDPP